MLAKIREKVQGIIATVILTFLAIPFVLWGIGSYFEGGSDQPIAEVDGIEITQRAFLDRLDEVRAANPGAVDSQAMKQLILDNMIDQTLALAAARDAGYRTSDAQLAKIIQEVPYFQRDGRFEPALYEALLSQRGLRPVDFEAQLRNDYLAVQQQRGLTESAFATDAEIERMLRLLLQERRVAYARIKPEALVPAIAVDAKEIEDYYRANTDEFRTAEQVRIEYLRLNAEEIARQIVPTEEELREVYAAEAARYVTPERRRASHILIEVLPGADTAAVEAARKKAEDLLKRARGGADFGALAKQHSNDGASAAKGGDIGDVARGILPAELEAAVYALKKPGELTGVVRTEYGFHIAKLTEYEPEKRRAFETVREELSQLVRKRKGEERFFDLAERFRNLVYEHPDTLEVAAKDLDLKIRTSDWFARTGGDGIAAQPRVVQAAFEPEVLNRERNSDAVEVDAQTLVAVRVIDHRPSTVRPLEEVREAIERRLKERRAREQARATAQAWVKQLADGASLEALATKGGAEFEAAKTLTRQKPGNTDPRLLKAVFAAPKPKDKPVYGLVDLDSKGTAVYALESVRDGDPAGADAALRASVRQQLLQRRGADFYVGYHAGLRKSADIEINAEQL